MLKLQMCLFRKLSSQKYCFANFLILQRQKQLEFILYYKLWCKMVYVVLTFTLFCSVGFMALSCMRLIYKKMRSIGTSTLDIFLQENPTRVRRHKFAPDGSQTVAARFCHRVPCHQATAQSSCMRLIDHYGCPTYQQDEN